MFFSRYLADVIGHALQIVPPVLLYFRCVPPERFRRQKIRTIRTFFIILFEEILISSAVKFALLKYHPSIHPDMVTNLLIGAEFVVLMLVSPRLVRIAPGPNRIIVLMGLFCATLQYTVSQLILVAYPHEDTYDGPVLLVHLIVGFLLYYITDTQMTPFSRNYLLFRDNVRPTVRFIVTVMAIISVVQIYTVSRHIRPQELPLVALMSICMTFVYMLLIRYVVVIEQNLRTELHLLASQIRPHFIRNTMNTICSLVEEDTEATVRAIYDFSGFLRMNFEALEKDTPVPFSEEIEHTRFYLSIEKLRFGDELEIDIDTPVTDFELPALTIQPIVENAIRHGLRAKEGVGRLTLKTADGGTFHDVIITDDGAGFFDPSYQDENLPVENTGHYGLVNVRARLRQMVGGTLLIQSEPGKGTTVIIRIPNHRTHKNTEESHR